MFYIFLGPRTWKFFGIFPGRRTCEFLAFSLTAELQFLALSVTADLRVIAIFPKMLTYAFFSFFVTSNLEVFWHIFVTADLRVFDILP